MNSTNFYEDDGGDVNIASPPWNLAKQMVNEEVDFGQLWGKNGNNNLYLDTRTTDPALIEKEEEFKSQEWIAVLPLSELALMTMQNSTRHCQRKRKSDMDWKKQDTLSFPPSSLVGIRKNVKIHRNGMKENPLQPLLRRDELTALIMTSSCVNGCEGAPIFPWNSSGNQSGGGIFILSREQLKTLAHSVHSFQTSVIGGAQAWLKKIFPGGGGNLRTCFPNDMEDSSLSSSLRKCITIRYTNKKGKQAGPKKVASPLKKSEEINGSFPGGNIRIEIKRDWEHVSRRDGVNSPSLEDFLLEESLNLYYEGDMIRIRVTMFCKPEVTSCSQLEIDLVQSFVCETETDRCRRRIAKVLKRSLTTDFNWEKGVSASGIYFSIYSTFFEIPTIFPLELESSLKKFRISNFKYELRLRFFCEDNLGQTATSACSFPLNIQGEPEPNAYEMFTDA